MSRKSSWTVKDRLDALRQEKPKEGGVFQSFIDKLIREMEDHEPVTCTVNRHLRTRVFEFPAYTDPSAQPIIIYESGSVRAHLVVDVAAHFSRSGSDHSRLSPCLGYEALEKSLKPDPQKSDASLYLVIEESDEFPPVLLGQCASVPEVRVRDGEEIPILWGGRVGERFLLAIRTTLGAWPRIAGNEPTVRAILAMVRASRDVANEIRQKLDQHSLVTVEGEFVDILNYDVSTTGGPQVRATWTPEELSTYAANLHKAIPRLVKAMSTEHIELLVDALYWDEYGDDNFRRLHYLRLWQSLSEAREKLGYTSRSSVANDQTVLAGDRSLAALTKHRNDVAHWHADVLDESYLFDMYYSLNELLRRNFFS